MTKQIMTRTDRPEKVLPQSVVALNPWGHHLYPTDSGRPRITNVGGILQITRINTEERGRSIPSRCVCGIARASSADSACPWHAVEEAEKAKPFQRSLDSAKKTVETVFTHALAQSPPDESGG